MKQYSPFRFIFNYVRYLLVAKSRHDIHSPFVFDLINKVLKTPRSGINKEIESIRKLFLKDKNVIRFQDFGQAGKIKDISVANIARNSLKSPKYARLLGRLCHHFKVENAVELGTSLGISTAYMARNCSGKVFSYEGSNAVAEIARTGWNKIGIENIELYTGDFQETILQSTPDFPIPDIVFIDGHHQEKPLLLYFKRLFNISSANTVFIIDDIHWSPGMENAWLSIQQMPEVKVTIDLYFLGLVFLKKELSKENFRIRF